MFFTDPYLQRRHQTDNVKYVGTPRAQNYTYFSLVDKRLALYHQSLPNGGFE